MIKTVSRDRLTVFGWVALGLASAAAFSAGMHHALWAQSAGSPAALDANENAAVLAWLMGWSLVASAAGSAIVLLVLIVKRIATGQRPLLDILAFGITTALVMVTAALAPLWGAGSA